MRMRNQPSMWGSQNKGVELIRKHDLGFEQPSRAAREILSQKVKCDVWAGAGLASQCVKGFLLTQCSDSSCIVSFNSPTAAWSGGIIAPILPVRKQRQQEAMWFSQGPVFSATAFSRMRQWDFFHRECSQDNRDLDLSPGSATTPPDGKAWRISF